MDEGRPNRPHKMPDIIWLTCSLAWRHDPSSRPDIGTIAKMLEEGLDDSSSRIMSETKLLGFEHVNSESRFVLDNQSTELPF